MQLFYQEIREKKRLASGARYKKRGSKSTKCPMSTDHMSHKQWKERNGPIMSYKLNQPMDLNDFKKMPSDVQELYIVNLKEKYNASQADLAEMFLVHPSTVRTLFAKLGFDKLYPRGGKHMSEEQRLAWNRFLSHQTDDPAPVVECAVSNHADTIEEAEEISPVEKETDASLVSHKSPVYTEVNIEIPSLSVAFTGSLDLTMIAEKLIAMLGQHPVGTLEISYHE